MVQATANVHVLRVKSEAYQGAYSPSIYLVVDDGHAVMIDGGLPDEASVREHIAYVKSIGNPRIELIVLTHHHFDHAGGALLLSEAIGAPIAMHPEEERLLRDALDRRARDPGVGALQRAVARVGRRLADGEVVPIGRLSLRAILTPGHSAGHLCFFLEEQRVLFSGDNVLGLGTTAIPPPPYGDMALYIRSLEKMKALDAALLCPGHGPLVHQPGRKIQELIDHRRARDEQVLALLREGETTVAGLVRRIYPELAPRLEGMAKGQVLAHLCKLRDEGRAGASGSGDDGSLSWRTV
jgi:glyoxylase-like metal-dependent hydrolase (beta-lactamase superfamily II)